MMKDAVLVEASLALLLMTLMMILPSCDGFQPLSWKTTRTPPTTARTIQTPRALTRRTGASSSVREVASSVNVTLQFPSYPQLMALQPGECVVSETVTVDDQFDFCVKLYPRGGGHASSYSVLSSQNRERNSPSGSWLKAANTDERVGAYVQFLPRTPTDTVDATFAIRMKGQQRSFPKFDVEWRAGIQFVDLADSQLAQGRANDFGAHLMQTHLLRDFCGYRDLENNMNDETPVTVQLELVVHGSTVETAAAATAANNNENENNAWWSPRDLRDDPSSALRVGQIVVPVLSKLSERPAMFQQGTYPGVEYRILRIIDRATDTDLFARPTTARVDYELKPIYPLVTQLERPWPVRVSDESIPRLFSPGMYNALSAVGSLATAVTGLLAAFVISQAVSIFVIPSRSMEPTLQVGDVLLVDKVTPRLSNALHWNNYPAWIGKVVLFRPTDRLQDLVYRTSGRYIGDRELFVKRVAAGPGAVLRVTDRSGAVAVDGKPARPSACGQEPTRLIEQYLKEGDAYTVGPDEIAVLGDCGPVSIDSRVWGPLPAGNVVGQPIVRIWPLSRFGPLEPFLATEWED